MNIIKLKDMRHPDDELFNTRLRGQYAYWINMRYIVPMDAITPMEYIMYERGLQHIDTIPYIDTNDACCHQILEYIDNEETNKINSVSFFELSNTYVPKEHTIDELKPFRTWLAQQLLEIDSKQEIHPHYDTYINNMLKFYADNMYDSVLEMLSLAMNHQESLNEHHCSCCGEPKDLKGLLGIYTTVGGMPVVSKPGCGCGSGQVLPTAPIIGTQCDPIALYKQFIYNIMVNTFSNIEFWTVLPATFIEEMKSYIDDIIRARLPLYKKIDITQSVFRDCTDNDALTEQERNMDILKRLSKSLDYIAKFELESNKLYIKDALTDWAKYLYEKMYWA